MSNPKNEVNKIKYQKEILQFLVTVLRCSINSMWIKIEYVLKQYLIHILIEILVNAPMIDKYSLNILHGKLHVQEKIFIVAKVRFL